MSKTFAIRVMRLVILPFPAAAVICFAGLSALDHYLRPDRTHIERAPLESCGTFLIVFLVAVLQLVWGVPSVLWLDRRRAGWPGYALVGAVSSLMLSFGFATVFQSPRLGETLGWMFSWIFLFFGLPTWLGYLAAFWLRAFSREKTSSRRRRPRSTGVRAFRYFPLSVKMNRARGGKCDAEKGGD